MTRKEKQKQETRKLLEDMNETKWNGRKPELEEKYGIT